MKKLLSLLLALVMVLSLAACNTAPGGSDETTTAPTSTKSTETTAPNAEELEYVELVWHVTEPVGTDLAIIQEALDEYFLEKLNCKVTLQAYASGEFAEAVGTKLTSGEAVDIAMLPSTLPYSVGAEMGAFYPIDELWDEYGADIKGLFSTEVWDSMKASDGHIYAVPSLKDNAYIIGYIYNEDLANELGLDMSNLDWDSFMDVEEFTMNALELRNEKYPEWADMPITGNMGTNLNPYFFQTEKLAGNNLAICNIPGMEVDDQYSIDTVFNFYETDAFREYCLLRQRLVSSGALAYDESTLERHIGMETSTLFIPSWGLIWIKDHYYSEDFTSKLVVFDTIWSDSSNYSAISNVIGANCKNPERAMMVLNLVNSDPELATLLRFGVEGEHWEYNDEGEMELTNRNADTSNPGWLEWYGGRYGNVTIIDGPESYVGPDGIVLDLMAEYTNSATLAAHTGFVLNTEPIVNEIAACNNVIKEYEYLLKGQLDSQDAVNTAVDEMIAKLKANGSEKIIEEVQAQLTAWVNG